jgi:serralysin
MSQGFPQRGFCRRTFMNGLAAASAASLLPCQGYSQSRTTPVSPSMLCIPTGWMPISDGNDPATGAEAAESSDPPVSVMEAVVAELQGKGDFRARVGRPWNSPRSTASPEAREIASFAPAVEVVSAPAPAEAAAFTKWQEKDLRLFFFDESRPARVDKVLDTIQEWSNACGLTFTKVNRPNDAHIRMSFRPGVNVSLLGTASEKGTLGPQASSQFGVPPNASMNIDLQNVARDRYLILHEFGHAIGLIHEHQHPDRGGAWTFSQNVFAHFAQIGWSAAMVRQQFLDVFNRNNLAKTGVFDRDSVMTYAIPQALLSSGTGIEEKYELSDGDKLFVAELYGPGTGTTPGTGGGGNPAVTNETQQLSADGALKASAIKQAGGQANFEFTVPATRSGADYTIGTQGSTQVMLRLYGPNDPTREVVVRPGIDEGTPDLVNHVLRLRLDAGKYVVRATHLSKGGGGYLDAYLLEGRQDIRLGRR